TTRFRMVRYEAGLDAHAEERPWPGWDSLPPDVRARWREPEGQVAQLVEYRYAEGPGVLGDEAAVAFYGWLAGGAWPWRRERGPTEAEPEPEGTVKMFAPVIAEEAAATDKRGGFRSGS